MKGGNPKLNLGVKKAKDGDFQRQISINFFKILPAAAKDPSSLEICCEQYLNCVFTVISTQTTTILLTCKKCRKISSAKEGEPIFQVWNGGKKGRTKFFPKSYGGTKAFYAVEKCHFQWGGWKALQSNKLVYELFV